MYLLVEAARRAGVRLVLVGIGVGAVLESLNAYLLTRAALEDAMAARALVRRQPQRTRLGALWPSRPALARARAARARARAPAALLEMGDDGAGALGVRVERSRLAIDLRGGRADRRRDRVGRPDRVRRARRARRSPAGSRGSAAPGLLAAGLIGALLLAASDVIAQRLLERRPPVGVVTGALGGVYLGWLLSARRSRT